MKRILAVLITISLLISSMAGFAEEMKKNAPLAGEPVFSDQQDGREKLVEGSDTARQKLLGSLDEIEGDGEDDEDEYAEGEDEEGEYELDSFGRRKKKMIDPEVCTDTQGLEDELPDEQGTPEIPDQVNDPEGQQGTPETPAQANEPEGQQGTPETPTQDNKQEGQQGTPETPNQDNEQEGQQGTPETTDLPEASGQEADHKEELTEAKRGLPKMMALGTTPELKQQVIEEPEQENGQEGGQVPAETPEQGNEAQGEPALLKSAPMKSAALNPGEIENVENGMAATLFTQAEKPAEETQETTSRKVRVAILSDIHYVLDNTTSEEGEKNLEMAANTEMRLMKEIDAILAAALDEASDTNPDVLLVCGDLVSNGEKSGALALSERLKSSREKEGLKDTGIYVVNGNHDINNSYAADFSGDTIENALRVQPSDFATVFAGLGYGEDDHYEGGSHSVYTPADDDPTAVANHGGLSYAADVAEGVTLIVLDTAIYRTDEAEETRYNEAQKTGGYVSEGLLDWAAEQARAAREKGNLVLAMSHHGLMPHYSTTEEQAWYMDSFRVTNWETVADTLADAGVTAVLTGHTHANDIAKHVSKNNNVLYDIETAALTAYPCAWRTMDIEINGEGDEKTYTFSIDTSLVQGEDIQGDTSGWTFTINGNAKTFDGDYNGSLQDYAYEKTSFNDTTLPLVADYLIKNMVYDMVNAEGGLNGYLEKTLELEEGSSLGTWATSNIREQLDKLDGFTQTVSILGSDYKIRLDKAETDSPLMPKFDVMFHAVKEPDAEKQAQQAEQPEETDGTLTFDLTYIATAVHDFVQNAQNQLEMGDWRSNNYASAPLLDELSALVKQAVLPSLEKQLDPDDKESTAANIISHAWQAFSAGDEADEDAAAFAHERELLTGEVLTESLRQDMWKEALNLNSRSRYPVISQLLEQRLVGEGKTSIAIVDAKPTSAEYYAFGTMILGGLDSLSNAMNVMKFLDSYAGVNLIPASAVQPIEQKLVDLHETLTVDENIPEDNQWSFHSVRFDANGGSVEQSHGLTVEEHRLVSLPQPEARENFDFDGWFTQAEGGRRVFAGEDMTGITTLFAHWSPIEDDDDAYDDAYSAMEDNLHDRFGSRDAVHSLAAAEYANDAHAEFCAKLAAGIRNGEKRVNMGKWLTLDHQAVSAIEAANAPFTIVFAGLWVVIPAGTSLQRYADANGSVCVVCLAEAFGYKPLY